jgi:UDP-N-acetylglucosamine--N-acetylmuramyl-(pentapeptide) pyrophosphoryl-undecaprenol N-acetylglucosamine transferase
MSRAVGAGTILIMAGGTGGHVMPGLAVAHYMKERAWNVVWLGHPEGMEARLVPQHGIPLKGVRFGGLRGKGLLTALLLPLNLLRAFAQTLMVIREVKPSVVLGLGGYISFPGGMMASLLGRPLVLHEQNSVAGLANRVLARLADRVLVAFPDALPGARWCGNPVRSAIGALPDPVQRYASRQGPLHILVFGGSLGAQVLNQVIPEALGLVREQGGALPVVRHQTGRGHLQSVQAAYLKAGVGAQASEFIDDMAAAYGWADLVICRAGALTVSELAAAGVASWLVPLPHAVDDHQTGNARFLSDKQAARLWPQPEFQAAGVAQALHSVERGSLVKIAQAARALAQPDATEVVASTCSEIAKR